MKEMERLLELYPEYRDKIFIRGFLFTDIQQDTTAYPFYDLWQKEDIAGFYLYVSPEQRLYHVQNEDEYLILIGHAYDPVRLIAAEKQILMEMLSLLSNHELFFDALNRLTGVFTMIRINRNGVYVIGDATCMQATYYTIWKGHIYITSHTTLLRDMLGLDMDPYIERLVSYRFFSLFGNALPGDLTPYVSVKRLVPNHYLWISGGEIDTRRFYIPHKLSLSVKEITDRSAELLHNSLMLISNKWAHPAISCTGGCDSKTTLACASGMYSNFSYFSYVSNDSEKADADAASKITKALGIPHRIYLIPDKDEKTKDIEIVRRILEYNTGDICPLNQNDIRKRAYFAEIHDFDIEVKSWVSEIGRAYYSKRFNGRKSFGVYPTPRKCTTMYKFFLHNRKLVRETDQVFQDYLTRYFESDPMAPVEWQDQFFWEYRVSAWNGRVITGEQRYSFDITIPYNNRILLSFLLSASVDQRIHDMIYQKIRDKMNPDIDRTGISVQNLKHTKRRAWLENIYYIFNNMMV